MAARGASPAVIPTVRNILRDLAQQKNPAQAKHLRRFFRTGPGEYGAGDQFWGLKVPQTRAILGRYGPIPLPVAAELLAHPVHEARFFAAIALARDYAKATPAARVAIFNFYLAHARRINNWDLVDLSAPNIVGVHLPAGGGRQVLARLARSTNMWERRIAIVATYTHIRQGDLRNTFWLAERLLNDPEDLLHKATGWMLREAGKRDPAALRDFLQRFAPRMPRTMLRYAIEKFPPAERRAWLTFGK
ncbi:MAG TPA: DNA alkylation repair protein [Kiritimatiellia bacterium]|jgi:3-methyladenine DNA glycosylase AlkD|nr:DNA alkylation repair protein [Kiritimatiellia bacterium]MBP9571868.1 DNA alkylation repair protein [Kiritimatiellia bacterium]HQF20432.1 DNA alkylation repair protein [Kiritimatiellia bacterium]HQG74558.1 DNA alkylation repair protein [Kiritimatiellia bacterium]HXK79640.1 DNA alkylation repair protein [Kiritimatiellia bacterium]